MSYLGADTFQNCNTPALRAYTKLTLYQTHLYQYVCRITQCKYNVNKEIKKNMNMKYDKNPA